MNWEAITDNVPHEWKPALFVGITLLTAIGSSTLYLDTKKADRNMSEVQTEVIMERLDRMDARVNRRFDRLEDQLLEKQDKP